ncbi:PREDICTED: kelch-like protein 22 isoform X1 [Cyprinodon variegatus]|uniref:Kelch-like family member 22 n=1 Tax=Cyprinodon variegatus TaxID=28743 RepID=A0A3Q2D2J9_CYPVA|nr:PREDICTED: kelch-like protein 22 isoform X1 [Cyprinodon variegatus]XP_015225501.1 PREDICTED: kelch-like protein 22 isoform X1 [Cyprinodon variegatus]XP_015225502.1 PREDICTED: kelch-like protein 22 isoform X1 [Cyprinodon variegatus]
MKPEGQRFDMEGQQLVGSIKQPGRLDRQVFRCRSHFPGLMDGMQTLRQSGTLFDVVLLVEGRSIQAHRVLLAASCHYFRGMFTGGLRETQQTEIPIHGVSYTAMKKILDYIYTSEIELDLENVQEILIAATLFQLDTVISFCCDFLISWMDESNILEVLHLADVYGLEHLKEKVQSYIQSNIQTLSRMDVYRQLPEEDVFEALSSDTLQVVSENEVYEAALHYHYSPEEVETDQVYLQVSPKANLRMLDAVRFSLIEKQVLQRLHSRLSPCPLKDSVSAALRYHEQELLQPVLQSPLTQPRSTFHCILGFGGMYSSSSYVETDHVFQLFHPSWSEWRTLKASHAPRMSNQGIAVLNNFVYLIGGDKNSSGFRAESRCWRYDPRYNSWCSIQPLQRQHADHCVCVAGGHIYAIGGRDYRSELNCVERYDPSTNMWEFVAPMKREVYAHAGAAVDGKIYLTCGRRGMAYLRETYCFDPAADNWTACADGPVERAWHGMAAVNGRLYVIGGSNDQRGIRRDVLQVACFEPSANSWSLVTPLPSGHGEPGIAVLDSRIYVLCGRSHDRGNRMKYVHVYNTDTGEWESQTEFRRRVSGLAACVALMPPVVIAQARGWEQSSKAPSDEADIDNSEESSDD